MRLPPLLVALCGCMGIAAAAPRMGNAGQYRERRAELAKKMNDGLIILFGHSDKDTEDLRGAFVQEPNFYYLTGWREPGAILMLAPLASDTKAPGYSAQTALPREILFLPQRNLEQEKWTGIKLGPENSDARRLTGFDTVLPAETMETELRKMLDVYPRIYTLTERPTTRRLETLAPLRQISSAALAIARLRMMKSSEEQALLRNSIDATIEAHRSAWKRAAAGLYEYQIAATMMEVYFDKGCERSGYPPIVGSGPNSVVLHYSDNSRRMDRGELLLMDVGAECSGYTSDITRTIPLGGKFNRRQREIYDIVLGAQKAAIAAIKPGMSLGKTAPNSIYKIALEYIDSHGKDLHGGSLGKYFIHGIGHQVGLEVHDASDPVLPLEAGMVITIEPGIYIPEEGIGIRIEDMLLVTPTGSKLLTGALPREPAEIERTLSKPSP